MLSAVYRWRFTILLVTLLATLLIGPVAMEAMERTAPTAVSPCSLLITIVLCLAIVFAVSGHRGVLLFALGLVMPVVALDLAGVFVVLTGFSLVRDGVRALFLGFVIVELLRHLFRARHISFDTISASLCVYLILGSF